MYPKKALEYVEMMTHEIDDLLAKVSPGLVELYEKNPLPDGKTLRQVNEEYKAMKDKNPRAFCKAVFSYGVPVTLVIFVLTIHWIFHSKGNPYVEVIPLVVWTILFMTIGTLLTKKVDKTEKALDVSSSILEGFRRTMEGLDIPENPESIRSLLVTHAVKILDYEAKFDEVRKQNERNVKKILCYGKYLEGHQQIFQAVLDLAWESLGLKFDKARIFDLAKTDSLLKA